MKKKQPAPAPDQDLQGEGNYDATRRYDKAAREFVQSGQVDEAAQAARPANAEEADAMKEAERTGRSRSKGEDPAVARGPKPGKE